MKPGRMKPGRMKKCEGCNKTETDDDVLECMQNRFTVGQMLLCYACREARLIEKDYI